MIVLTKCICNSLQLWNKFSERLTILPFWPPKQRTMGRVWPVDSLISLNTPAAASSLLDRAGRLWTVQLHECLNAYLCLLAKL